ncbi:MAG: hypothetical protein NVV62_18595 [Terricaulis sp.]|nr:hypothetical protein [Terricaulis sp.]
MFKRAAALMVCFTLAACGPREEAAPPAPTGPDPAVMDIEIGRYGAMLDQVEALTMDRPGAVELANTDARVLARRLRETVWTYNIQRSRLCGRGLFRDIACGPAFEPVWINEPMDAAPSIEILAERQAAVDALVLPFWNAVCADARTRAVQVEGGICPME